jgi:hypothetical protein
MMTNRLIPRSEWFQFFDAFSRRHQGWTTTVRVFSRRLGSQVEARNMPFEGIVARADADGPISIHLGSAPPRSNIEHEIEEPRQVWVELSEDGAEQALEVESKDGTQTVIEFGAAQTQGGRGAIAQKET